MANLYQTTYTVRIGPNGPASATVTRSYVWSGKLGIREGPNGNPPFASGIFDYYDDEDSRFGVIYHNNTTGETFGSETDCGLDNDDNGHPVDVSMEETLKVFYHGGKESRGDWVKK